MLKPLVLISGWVEVLFGTAAMLAPAMIVAGAGGAEVGEVTLTLVRLLGAGTFGIGIGALAGRNHLQERPTLASAYGLGSYGVLALVIYNLLAGPILLLCALTTHSAGLWAGAGLHLGFGVLFLIAIFGRR